MNSREIVEGILKFKKTEIIDIVKRDSFKKENITKGQLWKWLREDRIPFRVFLQICNELNISIEFKSNGLNISIDPSLLGKEKEND